MKLNRIYATFFLYAFFVLLTACVGGDSDSSTPDSTIKDFSIEASIEPASSGSVTGSGSYKEGSEFSLSAEPNQGFLFVGWEEDGVIFSSESVYEAVASENRQITAVFTGMEEIRVTPVDTEFPLYTSVLVTATAIFSDGSSRDVSDEVAWTSSDPSVADILSGTNTLESFTEGGVTLQASLYDINGAASATVTPPQIQEIELSSSGVSLALGETSDVTAVGNYLGNVSRDITDEALWTSGNESVASVSNESATAGRIASVGQGETTVAASLDGVSASLAVTVTEAALTHLVVEPGSENIPQGALLQYVATGNYTDGSSKDVTDQVTWSSDDETIVTVDNSASAPGQASAFEAGSVQITALLGEKSTQASLTVSPAPNAPGSLTLVANPNVILDDNTDSTNLTATVHPNDTESGVIADGTVVMFNVSSGNLLLADEQVNTVSEKAATTGSGDIRGQVDLTARVDGTIAEDTAVVRVVTSFSEVVSTSGSASFSKFNGWYQSGSKFSTTITNTSNRSFDVSEFAFFNGDAVLTSTTDPDLLGGGSLGAGESIGITVTLQSDQPDNGLKGVYYLSESSTVTEFTASHSF